MSFPYSYDSESSIDGSLQGAGGGWEPSSEEDSLSPHDSPSFTNILNNIDKSKISIDLNDSVPSKAFHPTDDAIEEENRTHSHLKDAIQACNKVSSCLEERGFAIAYVNTFDEASIMTWASTLLPSIMELCDRVESQRKAINDVSSVSRKDEISKDALYSKISELQALVHDHEQREKSLSAKVSSLERERDSTAKDEKSIETEFKKKIKNLQAQVQEYERKMRQKEIEFERLREKLHQMSLKDVQTNSRNKELLNMVEKGDYSMLDESFSSQGSKSSVASSRRSGSTMNIGSKKLKPSKVVFEGKAENLSLLVEAMDNNRRSLIARNKELELQVKDLLKQVKQNMQEEGDVSLNNSTNSEEERHYDSLNSSNISKKEQVELLELRDICGEQEEKIEDLLHKLEVSRSMQKESEYQMETMRKQNFELREAIENLRNELETRPSHKQWSRAQREIQELEHKVNDLVLLRGESEEIAQWRKHLSTTERIKVDKKNHELGLWLLESLPKTIMKETLQMVCRELDLSEISEIQASLTKLKAVVRMVPRMERFIAKISNFIFDRNEALLERVGIRHEQVDKSMEAVFPIIQRWWGLVQKCIDLEEFTEAIGKELFRAQELLSFKESHKKEIYKSEDELNRLWEEKGRQEWLTRHKNDAVKAIRDLVDLQVEILKSEKSLMNAENYIKDRPDVLVNRIVGHIQYLFDIKSVEGVLPCLNQVYIFNEEMKNFPSAVRMSLGKDKGASNATITAEVLHLLTKLKVRS